MGNFDQLLRGFAVGTTGAEDFDIFHFDNPH
jgi:hypothetical protein